MDTSENNVIQKNNSKIQSEKPVINATDVVFGVVEKNTLKNKLPIFEKCYKMPDYLKAGKNSVFHREIDLKIGTTVTWQGKEHLSFGYCDYLGLSTHQKIKEILIQSIQSDDLSVSSSRAIAGTTKKHIELENKLADFIGGESCILFMLGYMANSGAIPALMGTEKGIIFVDSKSHASIIDGCILSESKGTKVIPYKHNDLIDLTRKLESNVQVSSKLIVTDGVFSMDGDLANLPQLNEIAKRHEAALFVDDAHGVGMLGTTGAGTPEHFGMKGEIDLVMGTLSKSFPLLGGYVVGKKSVIEYLKSSSRSYLFCLGLPPYIIEAALVTIDIIKADLEGRKKLWQHANYLTIHLSKLGFKLSCSETPIISIIIHDYQKTFELTKMLENDSIFIDPIIYPGVKKNESRIRIVLNTLHTQNDLNRLLNLLQNAGASLGLI